LRSGLSGAFSWHPGNAIMRPMVLERWISREAIADSLIEAIGLFAD